MFLDFVLQTQFMILYQCSLFDLTLLKALKATPNPLKQIGWLLAVMLSYVLFQNEGSYFQ